jgi:hypothetical protein
MASVSTIAVHHHQNSLSNHLCDDGDDSDAPFQPFNEKLKKRMPHRHALKCTCRSLGAMHHPWQRCEGSVTIVAADTDDARFGIYVELW